MLYMFVFSFLYTVGLFWYFMPLPTLFLLSSTIMRFSVEYKTTSSHYNKFGKEVKS